MDNIGTVILWADLCKTEPNPILSKCTMQHFKLEAPTSKQQSCSFTLWIEYVLQFTKYFCCHKRCLTYSLLIDAGAVTLAHVTVKRPIVLRTFEVTGNTHNHLQVKNWYSVWEINITASPLASNVGVWLSCHNRLLAPPYRYPCHHSESYLISWSSGFTTVFVLF